MPEQSGIRFVFPHAPKRPITINGGMVMRGWYDIRAMDLTMGEDETGIRESEQQLLELVNAQVAQVGSEKVLLAGFSQGGAMVLHTGLRYPQPLCGVLALSTYLPLAGSLEAERNVANHSVPLLMMHGNYDPVIPLATAERSKGRLESAGYSVQWHTYPMQHAVCAEQIVTIGQWLRGRLFF